jgi:hypothetical protein
MPDVFTGVDVIDGRVTPYIGVVQSIEDHGPSAPAAKRWRVTLLDRYPLQEPPQEIVPGR